MAISYLITPTTTVVNMVNNGLFETSAQSLGAHPVILLIDASGSTMGPFVGNFTINEKIENVVSALPAEQYRAIFWNSDCHELTNNQNFPGGIIRPMHVINKSGIRAIFSFVRNKIKNNCLTYPHLGFQAIPHEWISNIAPTHIYFMTDGVMGPDNVPHLKNLLRIEIEKLFAQHNNIHLHLVTVEARTHDFSRVETLQVAAGGDVFELIQSNHLTKYITEFVCYAPNYVDGYHHINTVIPPAGYVSFGDRYFSEAKTPQFMQYLSDLIHQTKDEEALVKIIQSLSSTLRMLTKDKPKQLVENIVRTFCDLFQGTSIDPTMVQFMLAETIFLEQQGQAIVYAQYRSKLRDLYKRSQSILEQNCKNALGLTHEFITLPINDHVIYGNHMLINEDIHLIKTAYPNSSVKINLLTVPVLPLMTVPLSPLNEQCLRQFTRAIVGQQYRVDPKDDLVIYIVMGLTLRVLLSDVDSRFKHSYRLLAQAMLRKKRLNSDITELERLEAGELPIPNNGHMEQFYRFMETISHLLGLKCRPMTMWYLLCAILDNPALMTKQLIHCVEALKIDYLGVDPNMILSVVKIIPIIVHEKSLTDYKCIITLEDCSADGGFLFTAHQSPTGAHCSPVFVVSNHGREMILREGRVMCPVCYQQLTLETLGPIGPKKSDDAQIFPDETPSPFGRYLPIPSLSESVASDPVLGAAVAAPPQILGEKRILIILKGPVGSGKSTYAKALQTAIEISGGVCVNEGTDKYCVAGQSMQAACQMVGVQLRQIMSNPNPLKVVIIDTCGDRDGGSNIFGVDFRGWKTIRVHPNYCAQRQRGYLIWSLRNVLLRPIPGTDAKYWLNPVTAGLKTCIDVHRKKSTSLFGRKTDLNFSAKQSVDGVIDDLNKEADEYATYLSSSMHMEDEIAKMMKQIQM